MEADTMTTPEPTPRTIPNRSAHASAPVDRSRAAAAPGTAKPSHTPASAIDLRGVVRRQGTFTLGPLDLEVPAGSVVGFVGPNGAGKTTTLRVILSMTHSQSGVTRVLGSPPGHGNDSLGVVLEDATLPPTWDARASQRALARFYSTWDASLFAEMLERLQVPPRTAVKGLSRGERTKLGLALALAHRPRLLVLDEPTGGLDPVARSTVLDLCREFMVDPTHAILFSTHLTTDLEQIADRVHLLSRGRTLLEGPTPDIIEAHATVHCPRESLTASARRAIIGATLDAQGVVSGLIRTGDTALFGPDALIEEATLEDVVVRLCRSKPEKDS